MGVLAARLYPKHWRERAGGALWMRLTNEISYLKLAGAMALVGAVAGAALSFPQRYVSAAAIRITPLTNPAEPLNRAEAAMRVGSRAAVLTDLALSRGVLRKAVARFDLYPEERRRIPLEDVMERMRHDLELRPLRAASNDGAAVFQLTFEYPERDRAQAAVHWLASQLEEASAGLNGREEDDWQIWARGLTDREIRAAVLRAPPALGEQVEVLERASMPAPAAGPRRWAFVAAGLGAGLLLGLLAASAIRRPGWMLKMAAFALSGAALAAAASFLIPDRYTSAAVMLIRPPLDAKRWYGARGAVPVAERVRQIADEVLSSGSLAEIILRPSLDLYAKQRRRSSMQSVIAGMRDRDVRIAMRGSPPDCTFEISFTYNDPLTAQMVVRELIDRIMEANFDDIRVRAAGASPEFRSLLECKMGENLEMYLPPTRPEDATSPNRPAIGGTGFAGGIVLGAVVLEIRRRTAMAARPAPSVS